MSALPAEDPHEDARESGPDAEWRAPGTEPVASPVVAAVLASVHATLTELGGLSLTGLGDADVTTVLDELTGASSSLTRQVCRAAAEADRRRLGDATGARHTHQWWAGRSRHTHAEAARLTKLGRAFEDDLHAPVGAALADGRIRVEQARVIVAAVNAIPARVRMSDGTTRIIDPSARTQARDHLLTAAGEHDAKALRRLGRRILDLVAPELGEAQEAATLAAEEARADAEAEFTMTDDGEGRCHGSFVLPSHNGAMLWRHLQALANPARHTDDELRDQRRVEHGTEQDGWKPLRRRMGEAFIEYIERYPAGATPQTAGVNATIVITMTLEQLLGEHATALLDDGTRMSASLARRLACEAGIIPVILGSQSQPLDLGRTARFYNRAQRIALGLRDGGCTARGCGTTASGCHAHHDDPWSNGGSTDLMKGRLLCPHHHRLAHDPRYVMTVHADNTVTFHRRT